MAGAWRKAGEYLGLVEPDDYADESYDPQGRYAPEPQGRYAGGPATPARRDDFSPETRYAQGAYAAAEPAFDVTSSAAGIGAITTLHPRTYNEAREIGENFRSGTPVIMNLSDMDDTDAKRLVDFAAGLTFGLHGRIERVTTKVFLLIPRNVSLTAQDKARIAEGGFFNQS